MHPKTFFVLVHLKRGKLEKNENSLQLNFSSSTYRYRGCRSHSLSNRQRRISAATRTILRWECGWPGNPGRSLNLMFLSEFLVVGGKCWVKFSGFTIMLLHWKLERNTIRGHIENKRFLIQSNGEISFILCQIVSWHQIFWCAVHGTNLLHCHFMRWDGGGFRNLSGDPT